MTGVQYKAVGDAYRVGDDGSVWSCKTPGSYGMVPGRWTRLRPGARGGKHVTAHLGATARPQVRRLVWEAFNGPLPAGMTVRHLDGDVTNNRLDNLVPTRQGPSRAVLTDADVKAIMYLRRKEPGLGARNIVKRLGLPPERNAAVVAIISGYTWNRVTGLPRPMRRESPQEVA